MTSPLSVFGRVGCPKLHVLYRRTVGPEFDKSSKKFSGRCCITALSNGNQETFWLDTFYLTQDVSCQLAKQGFNFNKSVDTDRRTRAVLALRERWRSLPKIERWNSSAKKAA